MSAALDAEIAAALAKQPDDWLQALGRAMERQMLAPLLVGDDDRVHPRRLRDAAAAELARRGSAP